MGDELRSEFRRNLADINRQIAKAEAITARRSDDETLQSASECLKKLRDAKARAEGVLREVAELPNIRTRWMTQTNALTVLVAAALMLTLATVLHFAGPRGNDNRSENAPTTFDPR
jgi:hypothetical protein